jgi:hypothetical protein
MIVTFDRKASRLILSVWIPSYNTAPSVKMHRSNANVSELYRISSVWDKVTNAIAPFQILYGPLYRTSALGSWYHWEETYQYQRVDPTPV